MQSLSNWLTMTPLQSKHEHLVPSVTTGNGDLSEVGKNNVDPMISLLRSISNWVASFRDNYQEEKVEMIGEYDLIHVGQKHDWDCGVACLEMCLRWSHFDKFELYRSGLNITEFENEKSPLWTIDIFMSLHHFGVDSAVMYTNCKGIVSEDTFI